MEAATARAAATLEQQQQPKVTLPSVTTLVIELGCASTPLPRKAASAPDRMPPTPRADARDHRRDVGIWMEQYSSPRWWGVRATWGHHRSRRPPDLGWEHHVCQAVTPNAVSDFSPSWKLRRRHVRLSSELQLDPGSAESAEKCRKKVTSLVPYNMNMHICNHVTTGSRAKVYPRAHLEVTSRPRGWTSRDGAGARPGRQRPA